jgi:hypothetical protein
MLDALCLSVDGSSRGVCRLEVVRPTAIPLSAAGAFFTYDEEIDFHEITRRRNKFRGKINVVKSPISSSLYFLDIQI